VVLIQLTDHQTAHAAWKAIQDMFSSQSCARVIHLRQTLNDLKKRDNSATVYFGKLKAIVDELALAGKKLDEDDIINLLLNGLDSEYNPLVEAISGRVDQGITLSEAYSMLHTAEARLAAQNEDTGTRFSANLASRGGHGGYRGGGNGNRGDNNYGYNNYRGNGGGSYQGNGGNRGDYQGNGGGRGGYQGNGGRGGYNNGNRQQNNCPRYNGPPCQICAKLGHPASKCFKRFNRNFVTPEAQVNAATTNSHDPYWYIDTGAMDHITGELEKLTIRDRYNGNEQVHTASGQGMAIHHIGHASFHTPDRPIHLNHVLHVSQATKSLVSASKLVSDNNSFVEIHPNFFAIKDQAMGRTLLHGASKKGLYPLNGATSPLDEKQVLSASTPSSAQWHARLGHPSSSVVQQILSGNKISVSSKHNESVCMLVRKEKSHQLPYPKSSAPLELIFSDVWGPAPMSFGRYKYYVSFIDDYSKFTWIYLRKHKSDVF
jgi:histone deacetylase 1/2